MALRPWKPLKHSVESQNKRKKEKKVSVRVFERWLVTLKEPNDSIGFGQCSSWRLSNNNFRGV